MDDDRQALPSLTTSIDDALISIMAFWVEYFRQSLDAADGAVAEPDSRSATFLPVMNDAKTMFLVIQRLSWIALVMVTSEFLAVEFP